MKIKLIKPEPVTPYIRVQYGCESEAFNLTRSEARDMEVRIHRARVEAGWED